MKKRALLALLLVGLGLMVLQNRTKAVEIGNNSSTCSDVLFVFARGSSSNNEGANLDQPFKDPFYRVENETGRFFQQAKQDLDRDYPLVDYKAISIHNIPNKYNARGYPASGIFGIPTINNAINAQITWWPWGDYQDSVRDGREEVVGYLKDEIQRCPNQQIVLGGYSQGAQVAGEAVFDLSSSERQNIATLALFGDPKFVGGDYDPLKFWQKPNPYPWKRGTTSAKSRGLADARIPYVPTDMEKKTLSWCFEDDFVCSGYSGLRGFSKEAAGAGHKRYANFGIPQAADEAMQLLSPKLYTVEKSKGGVDKAKGVVQPVPYQPTTKPIDFMFMVNTSYNVDDVLYELRADTPTVLNSLNNFFGNTNYAVGDFNENSDYFNYIPRVNIRQNFSYYNPGDLSPRLINTMNRQLAWGGTSGGGEDVPDPHILAIEQAAVKGTWRGDAIKNLVIITDRPLKESYTYDLCAKNLRTNLDEAAPVVCSTSNQDQTLPVSAYPEVCKQILQVLTQTDCDIPPSSPYYSKKITRTIQDALAVARSKGIAISVVIPHAVKFAPGSTAAATEKQLENLAVATGGLCLKYDVFNRASYSDMMWQILNHQPRTLRLAAYNVTQLDQDWTNGNFAPIKQLATKVGVPTTLDVSQSNQTYDSYKWDFDNNGTWDEETSAPSTEHVFSDINSGGLLTVAGFTGSSQQATLTLPVTVSPYDGSLDDPIVATELPQNLLALRKLDGSIVVTWQASGDLPAILFIGDSTGVPIMSAPISQRSLIIPDGTGLGNELQAWAVGDSSSSPRSVIQIDQEQIPAVNDQPPVEEPITVTSIPDPPPIVQGPEPTTGPQTIIESTVATQYVTPVTTNNPQQTLFTPQVAGLETEKTAPQVTTSGAAKLGASKPQKRGLLPFLALLFIVAAGVFSVWAHRLRRV